MGLLSSVTAANRNSREFFLPFHSNPKLTFAHIAGSDKFKDKDVSNIKANLSLTPVE